jgi:sn-glycerol 3-phosphate transport system ATP-binding protein
MTLADRLIVMNHGSTEQLGPPQELYQHPANTYVAGFIGAPAMNFMPGVLSHNGTAVTLDLGPVIPFADGKRPGADGLRLTVGIRPEHIVANSAGLDLQVDLLEAPRPRNRRHRPPANNELLSVELPKNDAPTERMRVAYPAAQLHFFDAATGLRLDPA